MKNQPIGIFDSGIGGLTVFREIQQLLPYENLVYLGDTARVPYGTRSKKIITLFAQELIDYMLKQKCKIIVIACNTITATCFEELKNHSPIPLIGVITPSIEKIVTTTKNKRVGVLGTPATISSNIYPKKIHLLDSSIIVQSIACPLFVPLVEEGLSQSTITDEACRYYLTPLQKIDTLHLACTHYPLLKIPIQKFLGKNITIIDSAQPTAAEVLSLMQKNDLINRENIQGQRTIYLTDVSKRTKNLVNLFFEAPTSYSISQVTL